jgi:peptidyl-prolyl cis-trans isomerase C
METRFMMKSTPLPHRLDCPLVGGIYGAACLFLLALAGCSRDSAPQRTDAPRPPLAATEVARVGHAVISREMFEQEWQRRTGVCSKDALLQELIRFESILAKARAAGVDHDPEIVAAFNRLVVGKFQEKQLQQLGLNAIQLSETEIQAQYQSQLLRFTTPRQIRAGIIFCQASTKATPEKHEQLRQRANALWHQAQASDDDSFRQLALQHSEDQATRYAGGDTGWMVPEQTGSRWESAVIQAASALSKPGDLAPLVQTSRGFYIVKLLGTQPESRRPLEQVRDGIEYQLRKEKEQQLREDFFGEMQNGLVIEINRAALETVPDRAIQASTGQPPALPK